MRDIIPYALTIQPTNFQSICYQWVMIIGIFIILIYSDLLAKYYIGDIVDEEKKSKKNPAKK